MVHYEKKLGIKAWAEADRPREKLLLQGRRQLTDAELIAVLISSGNKIETAVDLSKRILNYCGNDLDKMARLEVKELSRFNGIGKAKAIAIVAALELGRRRKDKGEQELEKITSSKDVFAALHAKFADLDHEEFWILLLNRANIVIGKMCVSRGGQSGTVVDPKVIFKAAIEQNAAAIVLAHNHPSGNLKPSDSDVSISKKMKKAGALLEIQVLDHLIICGRSFTSLADESLM